MVSLVSLPKLSLPNATQKVLSKRQTDEISNCFHVFLHCSPEILSRHHFITWLQSFPQTPVATSMPLISSMENRFHSAKARPLKCPANWINCSSSVQLFQRAAVCKLGSQSSSHTSGFLPENLPLGGAPPFLDSLESESDIGSLVESSGKSSGDTLRSLSASCIFSCAIS